MNVPAVNALGGAFRIVWLSALGLMAFAEAKGESAEEEPGRSSDSIIFGNVRFACCGTGNSSYEIMLRSVETGKNYSIKLTPRGDDKGYSFVKSVPPGRFYLSQLVAPKVAWMNKLFDAESSIEVPPGGNTYVGDWTFKLYVRETKYSVSYEMDSVSEFVLVNPGSSQESYFVAVIGKAALPLRVE